MELLSPAGSPEKLRHALLYGADAVYTAGRRFGLRAKATNLTDPELEEAVRFAHSLGRKVFVTVNIYARNSDLDELPAYLDFLKQIEVDAVIVSDPGVFTLARDAGLTIHISTQANVTSWGSAKFWCDQGASRIILARELILDEIREIKRKVPQIELEMFVHGAMCIAWSGRCLISAFLTDRSANQGLCTQPCRWEYDFMERQRPGETFTVSEDERGTYFFNSRDLSLIDRIPELVEAGLDSVKIEGRMKSLYYTAAVTRAYRAAIDGSVPVPQLRDELEKVSHRPYYEGFIDGFQSTDAQYYPSAAYIQDYRFLGEVCGWRDGMVEIDCKAKFVVGDEIEMIAPGFDADRFIDVDRMFEEDGTPAESARPNTKVLIPCDKKPPQGAILRKKA